MSNLSDDEIKREEWCAKYEWFIKEVLAREDLELRVLRANPTGDGDAEFEDYKNL